MVYLTEKNVIHKDIKPENILIDKDFHIKVWNTYNAWKSACVCDLHNPRLTSLCFSRLRTLASPPARHGVNSQRRSHAGRVVWAGRMGREAQARWATWLLSIWRVYTQSPLRSQMSTALRLWSGSSSQAKSHMQVSWKHLPQFTASSIKKRLTRWFTCLYSLLLI